MCCRSIDKKTLTDKIIHEYLHSKYDEFAADDTNIKNTKFVKGEASVNDTSAEAAATAGDGNAYATKTKTRRLEGPTSDYSTETRKCSTG